MNSPEDYLCDECPIRVASAERHNILLKLAAEAVQQWWYGDLNAELGEVIGDICNVDNLNLSNNESDIVYSCGAEHSSGRCKALIDSPVMTILGVEE